MESKIIFQETQTFNQLWVRVLVYFCSALGIGLVGYGMIQQLVFGNPWGNNPLPDRGLLFVGSIIILICLSLLLICHSLKLLTEIREDGIYYRFHPFHRTFRFIPWKDIKKYEVRTYSPLWDFGGWGIRYSLTGKGTAFNVKGNQGLQLELTNGKKILIGTQLPQELNRVMKSIVHI